MIAFFVLMVSLAREGSGKRSIRFNKLLNFLIFDMLIELGGIIYFIASVIG